jgi:hypothetical protein
MSLSKPAEGRTIRRKGIICPKLLHDYTYDRHTGPTNVEQHFELTHNDFDVMAGKLNGKPIIAQHGEIPIGKVLNNWRDGDTWKIEFEVDGSTLCGQEEILAIESGLKDRLSLKHHRGDMEPYEVSLVWDEGRPGSMIVAAGKKKSEEYKTSSDESMMRFPRAALIAMASSGFSLTPGTAEEEEKKKLQVIAEASAQNIQKAEALAKEHQEKAAQAEAKTKALERDAQGRFAAPAPAKTPTPAPAPVNPSPPVKPNDPTFLQFPGVADQMSSQLNGQMGVPPNPFAGLNNNGPTPMDLSTQMRAQMDSKIPPQSGFAQPVAANAPTPVINTGDPSMDAFLNDPTMPKAYKDSLMNSAYLRMQKEQEFKQKEKEYQSKLEASNVEAQRNQKVVEDYKTQHMLTNLEFQRKIVGIVDKLQEDKYKNEVQAGKMDSYILSDSGKAHMAMWRQKIIEHDAKLSMASQYSDEQRHRASLLFSYNSQQQQQAPTPMDTRSDPFVAAAKPSFTPSTADVQNGFNFKDLSSYGTVAAASPQSYAPPQPQQPQAMQFDMKSYHSEYKAKAASLSMQPWEKEGHPRLPYFFDNIVAASAYSQIVSASGSGPEPNRPLAPWEGTWNQHLEIHVKRGILPIQAAQKLSSKPGYLPPSVVAASKTPGGIGQVPKPYILEGRDQSWYPGLTAARFLPETLDILIGDGSDPGHRLANPFYDPNIHGESSKRQKS